LERLGRDASRLKDALEEDVPELALRGNSEVRELMDQRREELTTERMQQNAARNAEAAARNAEGA